MRSRVRRSRRAVPLSFWLTISLGTALLATRASEPATSGSAGSQQGAGVVARATPGNDRDLERDPDADAFNYGLGTQTFSPLYQFTGDTKLVETAKAIHELGSTVIKFYLGKEYERQCGIPLPKTVTNLVSLVHDEPSCRAVLEMPFRYYVLWAYCLTTPGWWANGFSADARRAEYTEIYELTRYLLTHYANSGKCFYLGHWEGDWYLLPHYNAATNPSPMAIEGMRAWLNTRQQAVDNAKHDTHHTGVEVFAYTEVNRVRDALEGKPRVINAVVPYVTNLDFVSYSSYDMENLKPAEVIATLNYAASQMPTNKAGMISGKRVFIGEYGWGTDPPELQEARSRRYAQTVLGWGSPFVLWWEMYNNEEGRSFCLINSNGVKTANYYFHQRFLNSAKLWVAEFRQNHGRVPTTQEYQRWAVETLENPLDPPVSLNVMTLGGVDQVKADAAVIRGSVRQGIYGEPWCHVFVAWGTHDGSTTLESWQHLLDLGANSRFGTTEFQPLMTPLEPNTAYHYRFYATNAQGIAWSGQCVTFTNR